MVETDAFHQPSCFSRSECLPKRFPAVSVQVIEHEVNLRCLFVGLRYDTSDLEGKVSFSSSVGVRDFSVSDLGFYRAEKIASAIPFVFVVSSSRFARLGGYGCSRILEQLLGLLIETHDWFFGVVRLFIEVKDILHALYELFVNLWHAPHFFPAKAGCLDWSDGSRWPR